MSVELLDARTSADLRARPLTYTAVGQALAGAPPPGYTSFTRTRLLSPGRTMEQAAHDLMTWQVHTRSGLHVAPSSTRVELDSVVLMRFGIGPVALRIPCRVVTVIDDADRCGFAYGTLSGHPESGEEAFILSREQAGGVRFTITAFSRPATRLARINGPVGRFMQRRMTDRYLHALR